MLKISKHVVGIVVTGMIAILVTTRYDHVYRSKIWENGHVDVVILPRENWVTKFERC